MKNKLIVLMFAVGGFLSSCSDAYQDDERGRPVSPYDVYKTAKDVNLGMNAVYGSIPVMSELGLGSIFTDESAKGVENGGQGISDGRLVFRMDPSNSYAGSIWSNYYSMINIVNRLMVVSENLMKVEDIDTAELTAHSDNIAELHVLRAFAYYKLFSYFTPDYKDDSGLSVILFDGVPPADYTYALPRNTVSEVEAFILADLDEAVKLRSGGWRGYNYMNDGVISAIKTKLFSMRGNWAEVIANGEKMFNTYSLANASEFKQYFNTKANDYVEITDKKEVIFQVKATPNTGPSPVSIWYSVQAKSYGSPFYEMGRSLFNAIDDLDSEHKGGDQTVERFDARFSVNLLVSDNGGSKILSNPDSVSQADYLAQDLLLVGKYPGISGSLRGGSVPVFRVADILLAVAEARAAQGDFGDFSDPESAISSPTETVANALIALRVNRTFDVSTNFMNSPLLSKTISNSEDAYSLILDERRVEFAFEGHRYLDMKRLGDLAGSAGFSRYEKDCVIGGCELNIASDGYKLTLPIPRAEMNAGGVTTDQQNPGY